MARAGSDLRVVDLRTLAPERWFDIERAPAGLSAAADGARSDLALASPWALRLVALECETVVSRLGGYVAPTGALRLWSVRYRDTVPEGARDRIAQALVSQGVAMARDRLDVHFVESRPGYDSPHLRRLLAALESNGLRRVKQAHVYSAPAASWKYGRGDPPGLEIERVASVDGRTLALYDRVRACTLDRADAQKLEPLHAIRAELERQAPKGPAWAARLDDAMVGFLWVSLDDDEGKAWILDVGVDPERRRRGIARALLSRGLRELAEAGTSTLLALIDDENHPSIALHESLGMTRSEGPFWTYRLVV